MSAEPNATKATRTSKMPKMVRGRRGAGSGVMRLAGGGDQRHRLCGIEPAVVEGAAGDDAFEPRIVRMKQGAHLVERGEAAARDHRNCGRPRERSRGSEIE